MRITKLSLTATPTKLLLSLLMRRRLSILPRSALR